MIFVYFAPSTLQRRMTEVMDERELLKVVNQGINLYHFATQIDSVELDLAFAAAGGLSPWVMADNLPEVLEPTPTRAATFGDILVENHMGYVNLATPAGFIPLVDIVFSQGMLRQKQYN